MHKNSKISLAIASFAIAAVALVGCSPAAPSSASKPQPESTVAVDAPKGAAPTKTTFKDKALVSEDVAIRITDVKTIQVGEAGNEYGDKPVIAFWYDTTNASGRDVDSNIAWILNFKAYQDNDPNVENELQVASLPDPAFRESQSARIKKGGTVSNATAYELSDTTTPVKLVATSGIGDDNNGSMTFELK